MGSGLRSWAWIGALAVTAGAAGCGERGWSGVEVQHGDTGIRTHGFDGLDLEVRFEVRNPYANAVAFSGYELRFEVDGFAVRDGEVDRPLTVAGGATATLAVPLALPWRELGRRLTTRLPPEGLPYSVWGRLVPASGARGDRPTFQATGHLPVLLAPKVVLSNLHVEDLATGTITAVLSITLDNPGTAPITFRTFGYALTVAGRPVLRQTVTEPLVLEGSSRKTTSMKIGMKRDHPLADVLVEGSSVTAVLEGEALVDTGFGPVNLRFRDQRTLGGGGR